MLWAPPGFGSPREDFLRWQRALLPLGPQLSWQWDFRETPALFPPPGATHGHFPQWELPWVRVSHLLPSTCLGKRCAKRNHQEP